MCGKLRLEIQFQKTIDHCGQSARGKVNVEYDLSQGAAQL
jgi:hypothetical protein